MEGVLWLAEDASVPKLQPVANCAFLLRSGQSETIKVGGWGSIKTKVRRIALGNICKLVSDFLFCILAGNQTSTTNAESMDMNL